MATETTAETPARDPLALLEEIRGRWENVGLKTGMIFTLPPGYQHVGASAMDVPRLLKGYDALLKLAAEFDGKSAKLWEQIADLPGSEAVGASLRACTASAYQNAATGIRAAIDAALSAETAP